MVVAFFFETEVEIEILDDRQEDADKDGLHSKKKRRLLEPRIL